MPNQNLRVGQCVKGFEVVRAEHIEELRSEAVIFSHVKNRARVIHLFNDDANNLFSIAFRTPVNDNTGVSHILEHAVLCGSNKFRLKDPFQELLKGSLQTFLNALTYPDKTVYPVSSQVERDFFNLVDVYCDAVFHPLLSDNTFYQEGWHIHAEEDPASPFSIRGIVYSEMNGVYSDFSGYASRKAMAALFPDTSYRFESGGDPLCIPTLTAEALRAFHARYYHPSNSFIFLYGNIPSEKTLAFLSENYLDRYDYLEVPSTVDAQSLWRNPRRTEFEAPASREDEGTASVVAGWIWGDSTDPLAVLTGQVVSRYLLGTESSPLRRALVDSGLGEDLDDLTGFDADLRQSIFTAGLRKTRPALAEDVEQLIVRTIEKQLVEGLDDDLLEGSLRQTEFRLREISWSQRFPYHLMLAERCYRSWLYGGDPLAHLRFETPLGILRAEKQRGHGFFCEAIRSRLLENQHRLLSIAKASSQVAAELERRSRQKVKELTKDCTPSDFERYRVLTRQLIENQQRLPTPQELAQLPRLRRQDLPPQNRRVPTVTVANGPVQFFLHEIFCAGVVYVDIGFDFSVLEHHWLPLLPLYANLLTRCGAGRFAYEQMAKRVALATGGIGNSLSVHAAVDSVDRRLLLCLIHGKVLPQRVPELVEIFRDILLNPHLSNKKLIKDIVLEMRNDMKSAVVSEGSGFAMTHAAARLCGIGRIDETLTGISQLRFLDACVRKECFDELAEQLVLLHRRLVRQNGCVMSITADDPSHYAAICGELGCALPSYQASLPPAVTVPANEPAVCGIEIPAAVNFVAKARRITKTDPITAGLLFLLARHLSTGYLWDKVRVEGGAYGGSAVFSMAEPVFYCSSYRDPNIVQTLKIFDAAVSNLRQSLNEDALERSVIGAIGKIDIPRTPHQQGLMETIALLDGRTEEFRQRMREAILEATIEQLVSVAEDLFAATETATTVIGSSSALDEAEKCGLSIRRFPLLVEDKQTPTP